MELARGIVGEVGDNNMDLPVEIDEVYRLGKYNEGTDRPLKIKFRTQVAATKVLDKTWKLAQSEEYKDVWIREDLNEEERTKRKKLVNESKEKNDQRLESEKNEFYWRVINGQVKKWYKKK